MPNHQQKYHPELKPFLLDRDMVVYKVIGTDNKSEIIGFRYKPNTKYHLPTPMVPDAVTIGEASRTTFVIHEGYHAWRIKPWGDLSLSIRTSKIVQFLIITDSLVFFDIDDARVVSDTIISGDLEAL